MSYDLDDILNITVDFRGNKQYFCLGVDYTLYFLMEQIEQQFHVPVSGQRLLGLSRKHPIINRPPQYLLFETLGSLGVVDVTVKLMGSTANESASIQRGAPSSVVDLDAEDAAPYPYPSSRRVPIQIDDDEDDDISFVGTSYHQPYAMPQVQPAVPTYDLLDDDDDDIYFMTSHYYPPAAPSRPVYKLNLREIIADQAVLPYFHDHRFDEAFDFAKRENRILLAIVYNGREDESLHYVTEVLTSDFILEMVKEHFVLWLGDANDREAQASLQSMLARNAAALAQYFSTDILPSTAFISYLENSISLIDVIHGRAPVDTAVGKMLQTVEAFGPLLDQRRHYYLTDSAPKTETYMLLNEYDKRYQEAVRRDMELREYQRRYYEQVQEEQRKQLMLLRNRASKLRQLASRRAKQYPAFATEPEGTDTTTIKFRLPDGTSIARKFRLGDLVSAVFSWLDAFHSEHIYVTHSIPAAAFATQYVEDEDDDVQMVGAEEQIPIGSIDPIVQEVGDEALEHYFGQMFELYSNFPRKTYRLGTDGYLTIDYAKLRSAYLFVAEY